MKIIPESQPAIDRQGILLALLGTLFFSIKPVLIKLAYQLGGDAVTIMTLRAVSSLPLYLVILGWLLRKTDNRQKTARFGWQAVAVGILGYYLASLFDILALETISAQLERLLIFMFPSFVVVISLVFMKEQPRPGTFWSILLGYAGVAFIVAHDMQSLGDHIWLGSLYAVLSALIFSVYLVLSKKVINHLGSQLFTSLGMASSGMMILVHFQLAEGSIRSISPELALVGIAIGFFCTVLPSYLVAAAMARLTPSTVSLTSNIGPAATAIFAVTLLNEAFTLYHGIGMILVVAAVVRMNRKPRAVANPTAPEADVAGALSPEKTG